METGWTMGGSAILLNLMGAIALLLWATRLVKTGIQRAFGEKLRGMVGKATSNRLSACVIGLVVTTALQSSTATALLVSSFATRGLIALAPALAVMLGADIGSTLVVQALSFDLKALVPVMLIIGVAGFMLSESTLIRQSGRIIIGLSLMILSLGMIVAASASLRDNWLFTMLLSRLGDEPVLGVLVGALITWLIHSSVATVLLIISLAAAGVVTVPVALVLVLGANLGAGLIPLGLAFRESIVARRLLIGNLAFRAIGVLIGVLFLPLLIRLATQTGFEPPRLVALAHTAFNIALALVFLPLTGFAARLLERSVPDTGDATTDTRRPLHLDDALLDQPSLALGAASREVIRVAERVEAMLRDVIDAFHDSDGKRRVMIRKLDDEVDALQEAVKLYLTKLTRQPLGEAEARQAFDLILFTTNLEHVGDIIDKNLLELAEKRHRLALNFSEEGWQELTAFHARVLRQMTLAMTVFMTKDVAMARELIAEKDNIRIAEKKATEQHLARLRQGTTASLETSSLHLDILRDLKRINAHIVSVANPILEAVGEIRASRLRAPAE